MPVEREQLVWPVRPAQQARVTFDPPSTETQIVLPPDILLRYGARILDPGKAAQPGARRRDRDNLDGQDPGRPVPYQTTAYVAEEILVSAAGQAQNSLVSVEAQLNEVLKKQPARPGEGARVAARGDDVTAALDRARTSSPGVLRLAVAAGPAASAAVAAVPGAAETEDLLVLPAGPAFLAILMDPSANLALLQLEARPFADRLAQRLSL